MSSQVLQSYARYWLETFRLPVIPVARIMSGMHVNAEGEAKLFANLKAGRGVIIALPHMGNFEQAGAGRSTAARAPSPPSRSASGPNRLMRRSSGSARAWAWRCSR